MTDESTLDLGTTVRSESTRRRGYPVIWADPAEPFRVTAPAQSGRMVVAVGDQADPKLGWRLEHQPAELQAPSSLPPSERVSNLAVHGLFRGQRFDHTTRLVVFPRPEQVASHHPLSGLPRVAVRADAALFNKYGSSTGVVAFVLDASGSMGPPRGEPFTEQTRYGLATRALEQVMSELPPGTIVGLYSFGAAPPDRKEVPAEETIKTVQPLTPWDPSMLNSWMGQIRYPSIVPWSESPIVRTILSARDDLMSLNAPGLKTIIVITDGDDNRFTEDRVRNPQAKDVPTALKEAFRDTEIQLNVIGFRPTDAGEMERMNSQYQAISQFPVPGRFYYADNVAQIVANIRSTLRRELSYRIVGEDDQPLPDISARRVLISRPDANFRWFPVPLQPGGYKLTLQADQRISREPASLALNLGDLLLVNLVGAEAPIRFERGLFAKEFRPFSPSAFDSRNRWRLTILQHQRGTADSVQLLVAMERMPDSKETTLRLVRPRKSGSIWRLVRPTPPDRCPSGGPSEKVIQRPPGPLTYRPGPSTASRTVRADQRSEPGGATSSRLLQFAPCGPRTTLRSALVVCLVVPSRWPRRRS